MKFPVKKKNSPSHKNQFLNEQNLRVPLAETRVVHECGHT